MVATPGVGLATENGTTAAPQLQANLAVVEAIAEHIRITQDEGISWFGEVAAPPPQVTGELVSDALESHVADILYTACYVYGAPRPISTTRNDLPILSSNAHFVRKLIRAYRGADRWLPYFEGESDTTVTLWGVRYLKPEVYSDDPSRHLPTMLPMRSPGYVLFIGDRGPRDPATINDGTVRIYWNVTSSGAPVLVKRLTDALNNQREPFQFKVAHNASFWPERADIAVLYLTLNQLVARWDTIVSVHEQIQADARPWTPAFTRPIADGLAIADDPPGGLSFGQTITRILARGIREDHARYGDRSSHTTRVEHMAAALIAAGRGLESAHLNPGGAEPRLAAITRYQSVARCSGGPLQTRRRHPSDPARVIADLIVDHAVVADGRCTWLARRSDIAGSPVLESSGSELYDGTSGIALFLAHAGDLQDRPRVAEMAAIAAHSSLDGLSSVEHYHGLYGGRVGAAASVVAVGRTLDDASLRDAGTSYLLEAAAPAADDDAQLHDLIYGVSGTVLSYCWAALEAGTRARRELLKRAERLAERLHAVPRDALPGLAHGLSSSALALSVLGRMSGASGTWAYAVEAAVEQERRFYNPQTQNWPGGPSGVSESRFNWCYGAPGIAIARLIAGERFDNPESDLVAAVAATAKAANDFLGPAADPSTCHGKLAIVGVLELMRGLGWQPVDNPSTNRLLDEALDHYSQTDVVRRAPGLMNGAAGAGLAALRKSHPGQVRSPLLPLLPMFREDNR